MVEQHDGVYRGVLSGELKSLDDDKKFLVVDKTFNALSEEEVVNDARKFIEEKGGNIYFSHPWAR